MPGPPPARSDQRRRTNTPAAGQPVKAQAGERIEPPAPDLEWHPVALAWFESLKVSGQAVFYEASDWWTAYAVAESMSRELNPQPLVVGSGEHATVEMVLLPPKAASIAAWLKATTALLATEGDRRRAALELTRPAPAEEGGADVSHLDDARNRLRGSG